MPSNSLSDAMRPSANSNCAGPARLSTKRCRRWPGFVEVIQVQLVRVRNEFEHAVEISLHFARSANDEIRQDNVMEARRDEHRRARHHGIDLQGVPGLDVKSIIGLADLGIDDAAPSAAEGCGSGELEGQLDRIIVVRKPAPSYRGSTRMEGR